ncbi:MAG: TRAP transporter large permease [Myxococcales bacterium]|nr:TRAP transporter large permease [Myxococcales bacterium]
MIIGLALILLALIGAPLFSLFGAASMSLFMSMPEGTWASVAIDVFSAKFAEDPNLMTIPLFTFAGYLLAEAGTPQRLVELSRSWLGWMPGGLAAVCLMASAFFTTFTGGSGITIVAVGALLFPALMSEKYPENFSMGLVTTGGSLGLLFPPSVPLILYGIVAGLVIDKVLVAGILPGIVVVLALMVYGGYVGMRYGVKRSGFSMGPALQALWIAKWEVAIPIVLVGGFASGLLRVHEACAFTAVYVLFIEVVLYRDIDIRRDLPRIIVESMTLVGAILIIMATAIGFTSWMIQAQIPMQLLEWMESVVSSKLLFLLTLNVFLLVVGMLMDIFTAIVVVVPLILPMAYAYGVDPYHLAIIFLLNLEIGYLTPPVGINLFISSIRFGKPVTYLYTAVLPFIGILFIALMIVTYVPGITTVVPNMLKRDDDSTAQYIDKDAQRGAIGADAGLGGDLGLDDEDLGLTKEEMEELGLDPEDLGLDEEDLGLEPGDEEAQEPTDQPADEAEQPTGEAADQQPAE